MDAAIKADISKLMDCIYKNQLMMYPVCMHIITKTYKSAAQSTVDKVMYVLWDSNNKMPRRTIRFNPDFTAFMAAYAQDAMHCLNGDMTENVDANAIFVSCLDEKALPKKQTNQPQIFLKPQLDEGRMIIDCKNMPAYFDMQAFEKLLQQNFDCFSISYT